MNRIAGLKPLRHPKSKSKAADKSVRPTLLQQVPGFAVDFETGAFLTSIGIEPEIFSSGEGFYRDYVPEIEGDDVGDYYVDIALGQRDHLVLHIHIGMNGVAAVALVFGGTHLNSPEAVAGVKDEVVAVAISPGLGYAEAQGYDFVHEGQLGEFSATLGWLGVAQIRGRAMARV